MIPLFKPSCGEEEIEAVTRVMRSGWWAQGPESEAFEREFAAYADTRYAVAVSSGTAALRLAAMATGLTGGIVVCPALTFVSTALVMQQLGNQVVFADIEESTLTLNWKLAAAELNARNRSPGPRGVVPVWYAGNVSPLPPWSSTQLPILTRVIEDCAHAAGSFLAGSIGRAACWSFQAVKNLATGDGGMVTTDDEHVAREVRRLRWLGIDRSTWDRDKDAKIGYGWDYDIRAADGEKAQMSDIAAAIGRVQLRHLDERNAARREIAGIYHRSFSDVPWLSAPEISRDSSAHLYVVRVPAKDRDRFIQHMITRGVSAGVHYKPLTHYESAGRSLFGAQAPLPVTERVWQTLVTLPLFPDMTAGELEQVIEAVRSFPA